MSAEQLGFMEKTQSIVPRVHVFGRSRNAAELLISRTVSMDNVSQENTLADAAEHGIHHACVSKGLYTFITPFLQCSGQRQAGELFSLPGIIIPG